MPTVNLTLTGQALSKVDDTNVTLTLGGTPLTALLKATSITVGWTGQLSVARGGTGLGALGTANQLLRVNALGTALEYFTPSYGTGTVTSFAFTDSTGITGSVLNATTTPTLSLSLTSAAVGLGNVENTALSTWAGSTNLVTLGAAVTGAGSLTLGTSSSVAGTLVLKNATNAFTQTIRGTNPSASIIYDLPTTAPTAGQVLQSTAPVAGVATLSWATASSGITVGTTTITSGTSRRLGYNLAGVYQEAANELYFESASPYAHVFAAGRTGIITGLNNTFFGREAGKLITTGVRNTFIGSNVGAASTSSTSSSTLVGFLAGGNNPGSGVVAVGITTGGNNSTGSGVAIGNDAVIGNGAAQTVIGTSASTSGSSNNSTALGTSALASGTYGALALGSNCTASVSSGIAIGYNVSATHAYSIAIGGYGTATSAANQLMIGSSDATLGGTNGISEVCIGNGNAATSAASVTIRATSGSGSNNAGGSLTLAGGKGTGTAAGGTYKSQTSVKGSSGTTLQSLTDRHTVPAKYVDITDGAATTFGNLALTTSGTIAGGIIVYTVEANDGTDYQSLTGTAPYSVVNKAGTLTYVLGTDVQSSACSTGTLAGTLGLSASGTTLRFQMNAVSSLTETVLRISFQVLNQFGVATITAA